MGRKSLKLQQLERKMATLVPLNKLRLPNGWINTIRQGIGMSAKQLAARISLTRQGIHNMEQREQNGSITLQALREAGAAMDMQLVYGFIPKDGTLENLLERKARDLATRIVMRTHQTMSLEDQANEKERIEKAIEEMTQTIKNEMPKALWD